VIGSMKYATVLVFLLREQFPAGPHLTN